MKQAKLFFNGQSQAVRLPKEFRFSGDSVFIRKIGGIIMLIPKRKTWDYVAEACTKFSDDFMLTRDQGAVEREDFFQ